MISFFSKKKLNLLYIILPVYGILITVIVGTLHLDLNWMLILNPGMLIMLAFGMIGDEHNTHEIHMALGVIAYFIYWICASYITIKIIGKIMDVFFRKKSRTATDLLEYRKNTKPLATLISFFKNKKLNFLYIILPAYGILITVLTSELNLPLGEWNIILNPGFLIIMVFKIIGDKHNTHEIYMALGVIAYFIYWVLCIIYYHQNYRLV